MFGFSVLFGIGAHAEELDSLLGNAEALRTDTLQDIGFLIAKGADCSRYFSRFEPYLASSEGNLSQSLIAPYANIGSGTPEAFEQALAADDALTANINTIESTLGKRVPFPAFGSADQNLVKAFAADPNYPNCVATDPSDVNSTAQGKAYQDFKQRLQQLKLAVVALRNETSALDH